MGTGNETGLYEPACPEGICRSVWACLSGRYLQVCMGLSVRKVSAGRLVYIKKFGIKEEGPMGRTGVGNVCSRFVRNVFAGQPLHTKAGRRKLYACYTMLFAAVSLFVFSWYFFKGRTLIWNGDGWVQHYKALVYYARYLRGVFKELLAGHGLAFPAWDFNIGEGSDVLQAFHYYAVGDPFTLGAVFIPVRYMHLYYNAIILLRLYFAGLLFCMFCLEAGSPAADRPGTGCLEMYGILAGSLTYVFCYWALFNAQRHSFFLNPMVFFPLLLTGVEKVLKNKHGRLLAFAVFLSAVSNFYFFYMLAMLTALYVLIRLAVCYRGSREKRREARLLFLRIGAASVLGVLLAAGIFLPVCMLFFSDARVSSGDEGSLFYSYAYYSRLPSLLVSTGDDYWTCMGYAAPVLPAVVLLFWRKKNHLLKVLFLAGILIMCVPFLGRALNGFSYVTNRWSWAFAMLGAYILAVMWQPLLELVPGGKDSRAVTAGVAVYFVVCMALERSRTVMAFTAVCLALLFVALPACLCGQDGKRAGRVRQAAGLALVAASICTNSFWFYANAPGAGNYAAQSWGSGHVLEDLTANETAAVRDAAAADGAEDFYRYSGRGLTLNAGILEGPSSTQYYWSLSNPFVQEFRRVMGLEMEEVAVNYTGYDDRTALAALAAVRYYAAPVWDAGFVPYGYSHAATVNLKGAAREDALERLCMELGVEALTEDQIRMAEGPFLDERAVFRNDHALPLAYTYDGCISKEVWETLTAVQKQEALLQGAVLEGYAGGAKEARLSLHSKERAHSIRCNDSGVSIQKDRFVVTQAGASVTLEFEGLADSETYLSIDGLDFEGVPAYDLYFGAEENDPLRLYNRTNWENLSETERENIRREKRFWKAPPDTRLTVAASDGRRKVLTYYNKEHSCYSGRHDFTVNLGYAQEARTSVTVSFGRAGIYPLRALRVECLPMDGYAKQLSARGETVLEKAEIGTDEVTGEISLAAPKLLNLAIPYSKGWSAFVDGRKVKLYRSNVMYMALDLDAGRHTVRLTYHTPWLKEGMYISVFTGLACLCAALIRKFRRK